MKSQLLLLFLFGCLCVCSLSAEQTRLQRSTPSAEGINPAAVRDFTDQLEDVLMKTRQPVCGAVRGYMLLRNGKVVAEGFWSPFRADIPYELYSCTKSFASIGIGFAVQEKLLSIDDPVIRFFPEQLPEKVSENLAAMKVRDLLSMQSGQKHDMGREVWESADPARSFLAGEVEFQPGTRFLYDSGASHMLSLIIGKATGKTLEEYLIPRLFEPLGFGRYSWMKDRAGNTTGGSGLSLTLEDFAKFGQFLLDRGKWNGKQLLDPAWIDLASSVHADNGVLSGGVNMWNQGYGFQFWRGLAGSYRASGAMGQFANVLPADNAVLAMFSGSGREGWALDPLWETLVPAMRETYKPRSRDTDRELAEHLKKLEIVNEPSVAPPHRFDTGAEIRIDFAKENETRIDSLEIAFGKEQYSLEIGKEKLVFGNGRWLKGALNPAKPDEERPYAEVWGRAYWPRPDELLLVQYRIDCPEQRLLRFRFRDGSAVLEQNFWYHDDPAMAEGRVTLLAGTENKVTGTESRNADRLLKSWDLGKSDDSQFFLWVDESQAKCGMTLTDGAVRLKVESNQNPEKPTGIQFMTFYKDGFRSGTRYRIEATVQATQKFQATLVSLVNGGSFPAVAAESLRKRTIPAEVPVTFSIIFRPRTEITDLCRVPCFQLGCAPAGTEITIRDVKLYEMKD